MQTGERKGRHEATHHKLRHMIGEADAVADAVLDGEPESKFALFTKSLRSAPLISPRLWLGESIASPLVGEVLVLGPAAGDVLTNSTLPPAIVVGGTAAACAPGAVVAATPACASWSFDESKLSVRLPAATALAGLRLAVPRSTACFMADFVLSLMSPSRY